MANISGNPVWKDYPDTTTLIDAEALNNLETGLNNAATTAEWGKLTGVPNAFTPTAHAASHGEGGTDPVTPASIGAAVPVQDTGWRRILSWTAGVQDTTDQIATINTADYTLLGNGYIDLRRKGEWVYLRTAAAAADTFSTAGTNVALDFIPMFPAGFRIHEGGSGDVSTLNQDGPGVVEIRRNGGTGGLGFPTREGPLTPTRLSGAWWCFEGFPAEPYPGTPA